MNPIKKLFGKKEEKVNPIKQFITNYWEGVKYDLSNPYASKIFTSPFYYYGKSVKYVLDNPYKKEVIIGGAIGGVLTGIAAGAAVYLISINSAWDDIDSEIERCESELKDREK